MKPLFEFIALAIPTMLFCISYFFIAAGMAIGYFTDANTLSWAMFIMGGLFAVWQAYLYYISPNSFAVDPSLLELPPKKD